MPSVTVKAYAELVHTPLYGQLRILREQKYPRQTSGIFKIQYYRPALRCIERFYRTGEENHLAQSAAGLTGIGENEKRIEHNLRVISKFREGSQIERALTLRPVSTYDYDFGNMTVRCTPDFAITEDGTHRYLIYDCRCVESDEEIIRTTVELFHYSLAQNGTVIPMRNIEYVCIDTDTVFHWKTPRQRTITRANETGDGIAALWDTI